MTTAKTTKTKTPATIARERARAARSAQLAQQQAREKQIEDAATVFYLAAEKQDELAEEREQLLAALTARQAQLEREQAAAVSTLRELKEPAGQIASLLGVGVAEVNRLARLDGDDSRPDVAPAESATKQTTNAGGGSSWPAAAESEHAA